MPEAPGADLDAIRATVKQLATELLHRDSQLAGAVSCLGCHAHSCPPPQGPQHLASERTQALLPARPAVLPDCRPHAALKAASSLTSDDGSQSGRPPRRSPASAQAPVMALAWAATVLAGCCLHGPRLVVSVSHNPPLLLQAASYGPPATAGPSSTA